MTGPRQEVSPLRRRVAMLSMVTAMTGAVVAPFSRFLDRHVVLLAWWVGVVVLMVGVLIRQYLRLRREEGR